MSYAPMPAGFVAGSTNIDMPYKSKAQERWAHTPTGKKALGGAEKVKEWDRASKGKMLPERVAKKK